MSLARPILRDPRQVTLDASPGQILFTLTPTTPVLAVEDLVVETRVAPATGFTRRIDGFSVTLVDGGARVLFATPPRPAVADPVCTVRLTSRRTHERAADVTRGGAISSAALEEELDRQTLVLQELRRDADDAAAALGVAFAGAPAEGLLALVEAIRDDAHQASAAAAADRAAAELAAAGAAAQTLRDPILAAPAAAGLLDADRIPIVAGYATGQPLRSIAWADFYAEVVMAAQSEGAQRVVEAGGQVSLAGTAPAYHVLDPANEGRRHVALAAGQRIDVTAAEVGRLYWFSVYYNASYSLIVDFGPAAAVSGLPIGQQAVELRGGESLCIVKTTGQNFQIVAHYPADYELNAADYRYRHLGGGRYQLWRRVTVNAGVAASFGIGAAYTAGGVAGGPVALQPIAWSTGPFGSVEVKPPTLAAQTATSFSIYNPNPQPMVIDVTIDGLQTAAA